MSENDHCADYEVSEKDFLQKMRDGISRNGIQLIENDDHPSIVFTAGLTETLKAPELLIFGCPLEHAMIMLVRAIAHIETDGALIPGQRYPDSMELLDFTPTNVCQTVARDCCYFTYQLYPAANFIQLVWTDRAKRFPWEPGFDIKLLPDQPLLGSIPDRSALH